MISTNAAVSLVLFFECGLVWAQPLSTNTPQPKPTSSPVTATTANTNSTKPSSTKKIQTMASKLAAEKAAEKKVSIEIKEEPPKPPEYIWTLDDVRQIAENQNPDLKTAKAHFEEASSSVLEAVSGYLPHIDVTASWEQTTLPNPSAGATSQIGIPLPYTNAVASVKQTLFDFGKTLNDIGAHKAITHSAEQEALALKNAVDLGVRRAFYSLSAAEKIVDVTRQGVAKFEETHRRTAVLVRTGTRPSFDLTQSNVEVAQAKLDLVNAINARDLAKVTLLNIMGMPKEVEFRLKEPSPTKPVELKSLNLDTLTKKALESRPEMKRNEFAVEAASMELHREVKGYFPTVGLEGWYGEYLPNYPSAINTAWGGGVTLTWSLFDGLKTPGRVGEYEAKLSASDAQLEKEKQRIVAEVAASYMDLKKSQSNLQLAQDNLTFAKENARLARKRYDASVATFLELITADTSFLSAQATAVQAQYAYEIAIAALERAVNAPLFD